MYHLRGTGQKSTGDILARCNNLDRGDNLAWCDTLPQRSL